MATAARDTESRQGHTDDDPQEPDFLQEAPATDADDIEKANYTFNRWSRQREHYYGLYRLWSRAILFLLGRQWLEWNGTARRYTPEQNVPKWRMRPVTNLVFAVYRSAIAKLTKQRPTFDVVPPRTGDSQDREAAHLGESLLQQLWRSLAMPKWLAKAAGWLLATGNIAIRVYWDPEAGRRIPMTVPVQDENGNDIDVAADETGEPKMTQDAAGNDIPDLDAEPDYVFEGDVAVELIPPFSQRYNPDAQSKEEATELFLGYLMPRAVACKKWGLDPDDLAGGTDDELETIDDLISNAAGAQELLGMTALAGDRHEAIGTRVLVLEYYRKPCDDYPDGRHWITVNKTMATEEEPLPEGFWPPVVDIDDVPVPGDPHAMGLLSQVVPLNREYNSLNGKIAEQNVLMAMGGKWIVTPEDKHLKITSDPGQKLESRGYQNGKPPVQAELKTLPEGVYAERERIINDLQLVAGMNQIGMGQKPEGVGSGRGFLVLQEAVDSVLTPTLFNIENALQEVGRRFLVLARRHYREERILKVRGHNGRWEIRSFMGADLGDSVDVQVQIGSSFPWSKAARQDMVLQVIQAVTPLLPPGAMDLQKMGQMLDVGGIQAFEPEADPDETEVMLEHAQFEEYNPQKGVLSVPQPAFWQNHQAHYDLHARFLKQDRSRFERWDPRAQQLFLQHVLATRQLLQQAAAAMVPPGMPGGGGAGLPPGGPPAGITPPTAPGGPATGAGGPPPGAGPQAADQSLQPADFAAAGTGG